MSVPIRGIDHVVVMCRDIERSLAFYRDLLGGAAPYEKAFRAGRIPVVPIVLGGAVINLQRLDEPAYIVAERLESGTVDVCFRWEGPIEAAIAYLAERDIAVIEGPVPRVAADGVWGKSVYFRDPDGNLLEFLSTAEETEPLFTG
ncbi:MAG: VOC family protein [Alphaproteobacteria bacterium]|nr:VOC family protein [Alphaproteobacteria bacterium]